MSMVENRKRSFWHITCNDILTILCAAAVPVALGIYTAITYQQEQQQAMQAQQLTMNQTIESRQDKIYDNFLNNVYNLDKDGYLNETEKPWAFANAYYRAAHRQLDPLRKGDVLQFLKEKELIGRNDCSTGCNTKEVEDIIRLNELNFDDVHLKSQTGLLNRLNLECIIFDQVSMTNAIFSYANLNGASFDHGRLKNANFENTTLFCARFNGTNLDGVDFGNADFDNVYFENVDLSTAKLTDKQISQATFGNNVKLPNGKTTPKKPISSTTTKSTTTPERTTIKTASSLSSKKANTLPPPTTTATAPATTTSTSLLSTAAIISSTMTTITTTETKVITTQTTSKHCPDEQVLTQLGTCVNLNNDLNNCGQIGRACSSNYTACVSGKCTTPPTLRLVDGVPIFGNNDYSYDDEDEEIDLPFNIMLYDYSTSTVSVTPNGVVCLSFCSFSYENTDLPSRNFSGPVAFGYWDDLYIQSNTSQNIYYATSGIISNRTVTFEFITTHLDRLYEYYHFQIIFFENLPNIVKYVYFEASDKGISATVGVQEGTFGQSITYSVDEASVKPNMVLIFDTKLNKFMVE